MMLDVKKIRKDFPMLDERKTQQNHHRCYFDNGATTFKPYSVIEAENKYYIDENANSHRGDYDIAYKVDRKVDEVRNKIKDFIGANEASEIVFTSGASMSLNLVAFSYGLKFLLPGDEIIINEAEHASNVLPRFKISKITGAIIKYVSLDKDGKVTIDNLSKVLTKNTKIVAVAHVSNVLGITNDIKNISKFVHENSNAIVVCDGAQSVPHMKIDVKDLDCDFLAFSGHKMLGPTGIGVLYGKIELLNKIDPFLVGGGDNARFDKNLNVKYFDPPSKFEAGTLNLAGIYGLGAAIDYINEIGISNIHEYEKKLRKYAIDKLKTLQNLIIYNTNADNGIIAFNVKGVPAQDEATYLNSKGICVRSGEHCAKLLKDKIGNMGSVRVSLYFYNTFEEVDQLYEALKNGGDFLDAFFN